MAAASIYEITLPKDRQPIPDVTIHGEPAKREKTKDEVEKVLRYLGKA